MKFELEPEEWEVLHEFMRDEFYIRKFGEKESSLLATNDLRLYITNRFDEKVNQNSELKFILLLGHDNTLTSLLAAMDLS